MNLQRTHRAHSLRSSGLKVTLPRLKVLEVFAQAPSRHLSADDVSHALIGGGYDVGLPTVYRVLAHFEKAGLLCRTRLDGDKVHYELKHDDHHDHLVCLHCGRVEEFHDAEIERRQRAVAAAMGFELKEHALTLYGRCAAHACQNGELPGTAASTP